MTVLEMDPAKFPARAKALYDRIAARRRAKGEGFGGPYLALLNHPALAERVEALGFYLKFEGVLPRGPLSVHRAQCCARDRRRFRMARSCEACAGRRAAAEHRRWHCRRRRRDLPHPYALLREILTKTLAWQPIPDALQAQAAAEWGKDGLVEIVVVSGFYQMFAAINQGFDIASLK